MAILLSGSGVMGFPAKQGRPLEKEKAEPTGICYHSYHSCQNGGFSGFLSGGQVIRVIAGVLATTARSRMDTGL
jgi:hypothetical protein